MKPSKLVVISAEQGSGGREIAQELASSLDFGYLDGYILQALETERQPQSNPTSHPFWGVGTQNLLAQPDLPDVKPKPNWLARTMETHPNLIIYDSTAIYRLENLPNLLKIRIVAPLTVRIERLALLFGIDQNSAATLVTEADQSEKCFMRRDFDLDWDNPANFQLTLNTGDLTLSEATLYLAEFISSYHFNNFNTAAQSWISRSYDRLGVKEKYSLPEASNLLRLPCELLRQAVYSGSLPAEVREYYRQEVVISKSDLLNWQTKAGNRAIKQEGGKEDVF